MTDFFIFVDEENSLAIAGNPEDRDDEAIRVATIPEAGKDYTVFVLRNGDRITLDLPHGEIILKLQKANSPLRGKGTRHA